MTQPINATKMFTTFDSSQSRKISGKDPKQIITCKSVKILIVTLFKLAKKKKKVGGGERILSV